MRNSITGGTKTCYSDICCEIEWWNMYFINKMVKIFFRKPGLMRPVMHKTIFLMTIGKCNQLERENRTCVWRWNLRRMRTSIGGRRRQNRGRKFRFSDVLGDESEVALKRITTRYELISSVESCWRKVEHLMKWRLFMLLQSIYTKHGRTRLIGHILRHARMEENGTGGNRRRKYVQGMITLEIRATGNAWC